MSDPGIGDRTGEVSDVSRLSVCALCGQTPPRPHPTSDPQSQAVTEALSRPCDICRAKPGDLCTNTIRPGQPLPGRIVHHGRLENP